MANLTLIEAKKHCRVDTEAEDSLLQGYLSAAINYAEQYQTKNYTDESKDLDEMSEVTKQAILLLTAYYYDNREMSYNTLISAGVTNKTMQAVNNLLYFERKINI